MLKKGFSTWKSLLLIGIFVFALSSKLTQATKGKGDFHTNLDKLKDFAGVVYDTEKGGRMKDDENDSDDDETIPDYEAISSNDTVSDKNGTELGDPRGAIHINETRIVALQGIGILGVTGKNPDDYDISTTKEPKPMIYFSGQLSYNTECTSYGDEIHLVQRSAREVTEKMELLKTVAAIDHFGTKICNWAKARLECVVNEGRETTPTTTTPDPDNTEDNTETPVPKAKGKCKCLLAMGEKAVWIEDSDNPKLSKCYIPADLGYHSNCDFDILPPYGEIDETVKTKRNLGSAATMCVPLSRCTTSFRYVGLRCHCNRRTFFDKKTGICSKSNTITSVPVGYFLFLILLLK